MGTKSGTGPLAPLLQMSGCRNHWHGQVLGVEPVADCLQLETNTGIAREDVPRRWGWGTPLKKRIALSDQ